MEGRLHSIETFGAVDGPGIRTVFFLQGCPARCAYCHNPDTWNPNKGRAIQVEEIIKRAIRSKPYYGSRGGVTFSGGEPLLQGKFVIEAIKSLHECGIHCAVDTSGTYFDEDSDAVIAESDMLLLDVKHIDEVRFQELTGRHQGPLVDIIESINRHRKPIWIRQVVIPGFNDSKEYIDALNEFVNRIDTVEKIELLGYHDMGSKKYEELGINYKLKDVKPMSDDRLKELMALTKIKNR